MSLDAVAKVTKIQPRILERIEAGNLEGLPAEVFVRGFVRSFARCVGLDEGEALRRYAACGLAAAGSGEIAPAARALVEAMADLVPASATAARATPRKMLAVEVVDLAVDLTGLQSPPPGVVVETMRLPETGTLVLRAPTPPAAPSNALADAAPPLARASSDAIDAIDLPVIACASGGSSADSADSADSASADPAGSPVGSIDGSSAVFADGASADSTDGSPASDAAPSTASAGSIDASLSTGAPRVADVSSASSSMSLPLSVAVEPPGRKKKNRRAKRNKRANQPPREVLALGTPAGASPVVTPGATSMVTVDEPSASGTWAPRMPPIATTPTVPWRKPATTGAHAVVVPSLVIDDADPESAERVLEQRAEHHAPRRSFLPPILQDREDRSGRQGGLTLAVIILLIAATLTLSYLMRRPSASGDGMTRLEAPVPSALRG